MDEFFDGWRRKAGVITLVVACAFAVGWVRSVFCSDDFEWEVGDIGVVAQSRDSHLLIRFKFPDEPFKWDWPRIRSDAFMPFVDPIGECHRQPCLSCWLGFRFRIRDCGFIVTAPYDLIFRPLTLLSAWLVLSNTRQLMRHSQSTPPENPQRGSLRLQTQQRFSRLRRPRK